MKIDHLASHADGQYSQCGVTSRLGSSVVDEESCMEQERGNVPFSFPPARRARSGCWRTINSKSEPLMNSMVSMNPWDRRARSKEDTMESRREGKP